MILAGQLLLNGIPGHCRIAPGFVRIDDGVIREVVEGEIPSRFDRGGAHWLISPGFIDAHLHLPQFDIIGGHGMPLLQWLSEVTFPAERRWEDVDFAKAMTKRVLEQCIRHGTTAICAYATVHHLSAEAALEVASDYGMRGVIGHVLMDRNAPDYLCRGADELIDQSAELLEQFPPMTRMAAAVTPRFAISCSAGLLAAAGKLAASRGAIVQTHLAETVAECETVAQLFDDKGYVDVYREAGLLSTQTIFGHGIYLDSDDRNKLASSKAMIAHCPTANSFLRSGTMQRERLINERVSVLLGSDIGAGYERSMVRVARAMIEAASALSPAYPSAAEAWYSITKGNAERLGWHDAGALQNGAPADIVLIEPDLPWQAGLVDPLAFLMFAWDDRWIKQVMLRGIPRL
jgi:guanine deaminase